MKIALINENSQAAKNSMICENLKKIVEPMGHEVFNYGMYTAEDETQLTYVMCGLLSAILLNSKAADYVVTGCGTGLDEVKKITHTDMMTILKNIDQDFLKTAISGEKFQEYFFANCQVPEIAEYLKSVLNA